MDAMAATSFREHRFRATDGLMLYAREYGADNPETAKRMPIVCLAGLTRNSRDFHQLAERLSQDDETPYRVIAIDTRGRGRSERDPDASHYNIVTEASDAVAGCAALGIEKAAFIGTSRGGLILHVLIAAHPDLIGAAIFNDVGPAIGIDGLKLIQSYLGKAPRFSNFNDAAAALQITHSDAFPNLPAEEWLAFAEATFKEADGGLVADCDPAIAQATAALDLSQPLPELWDQFDLFKSKPVMTIRGGNSLLLTPGILSRMAEHHPHMHVLIAENQGHAPFLHLGVIPDAIKGFLNAI